MNKPFAITLDVGSSLVNHTGSWRTERPVYLDRLPPCNHTCPAGENIQQWLFHAEEGNYHLAWQEIMKNNPLPAVMGRACYHTCEVACNRAHVDEAVGIHAVERFLGDLALDNGWTVEVDAPASGKTILIVGAGPGGLSAAYHLTRLGHKAVVVDANEEPGGMMRYGIPRYRLPLKALDGDIARIKEMGVTFHMGVRVDDLHAAKTQYGADAVFMAIGAQRPRELDVHQDGSVDAFNAIDVLRAIQQGEKPNLGQRVIVYGGGNVAMDVARSAIRMGAAEVHVIARESEERLPAHKFEVKEAREEGVLIHPDRTVISIKDGAFKLEKMVTTSSEPFPTGQTEDLQGDTIILAVGQLVDTDCCLEGMDKIQIVRDTVQVSSQMMTGEEGIFAGGDMVPSPRNMTSAIGQGKKAARSIDAWLNGAVFEAPAKHEVVDHTMMNSWYYADAPKTIQPILDPIRRQSGFEEVLGNLDESNALFEARRCMSCGNCFECDNCYGCCPDNAITKLGPGKRFEFKYDYCKGCGLCAAECPCGAIKMERDGL
ncbi:NAD(P)-binding protein [Magnetococcus sp. PR-3]|uniref:NAD(P)-binding protein n=1 Tax=Magnetococcus sp. PR-3 TaxID=3120355 RepID=UPI002FCDEF4A